MSRKCQRFVFSSAPRGPGEVQERGRKGRAALVVSSRAGGAHVRQLLLAADVDLEVAGALVDADDLVLVHLVARCGEIWGDAGRCGEIWFSNTSSPGAAKSEPRSCAFFRP